MMDAIDGLAALEQVVETIGEQLDDLYQRRDIPQAERVTLRSLEWTLAKLADDLHTMETEVKDLRLAEAAARRGASEAQQNQRDEQLQSLSVFNELRWQLSQVTAERDELRAKAERKPWMEWQPPANVDKLYKRIPGDAIMVHKLLVGDDLPALYEAGWRYLPITPEAELTKKAGELPAEPAAEPYQWKAGDQVVRDGLVREVQYVQHANGLLRICKEGLAQQCDHEQAGWKLYRKASDKPAEPAPETYQWQVGDELIREDGTIHKITYSIGGLLWFKNQTTGGSAQWWLAQNGYRLHRKASDLGVQHLTPRQVEISDSTGTDGEGQP